MTEEKTTTVSTERLRELEALAESVKEEKRRREALQDEDIKVFAFEVRLPFSVLEGLVSGTVRGRTADKGHTDQMEDVLHTDGT